ncbi:restriction endonuclease subunit S [Mycoplasma sp. HF11B]|uniref:restriction endonuclease subunit S n=1 Tax=Mycoplasma sp. HF11B TaxID=3401681 RepID=UPI003AAC65EA
MQKEKLVPAIRFKGFDEEWEEYKISELSTYKNGESYEAFFVNNGKYNVINLNSITIGGGLKNSNKFVDICISSPLKKDDVVICLSDVAHGTLLGAAALIPFDNKFVLNQRVGLLRIKSDISPLFFVQSINNKQPYFKYHGAGSSQLNISKKCVEDCTITVPSIVEQHKIGKFMSTLNSLIHSQELKLEKLQSMKQSLLDKMFPLYDQKIPEIRFKGFDEPWSRTNLQRISFLRGRIGFRGYKKTDFVDKYKGAISLSPSDIDENGLVSFANNSFISIDKYEESPEIKVKIGDILFTKTASIGKIGYISYLPYLATINPQFALISVFPDKADSYFVYLCISNKSFLLNVSKITAGSSVLTMSQEKLKSIKFRTPNFKEQQKIGQFFSNLDSLIHSQELKLEKLNNIKQALLEKMFC